MDDTRVKETNKNRICKEKRLNMVGWLAGWLADLCDEHDTNGGSWQQLTAVYMCHFNYSNFFHWFGSFVRSFFRSFVRVWFIDKQLFATSTMWFCSHNDMINVPSITIATRHIPNVSLRKELFSLSIFSMPFFWTNQVIHNNRNCTIVYVAQKSFIAFYVFWWHLNLQLL